MKTLGEWRDIIDNDEVMQRLTSMDTTTGVQLRPILDSYFPSGNNEIVFDEQLKVRAILCGNEFSRKDRNLVEAGGFIVKEILRVLGF